jgi:hypothetical protein
MPPFWQLSDPPHTHSQCKDFSLHFYKPWNLTYWIPFVKGHLIQTQICTAETLQATAIRIGGKHDWKNYKMHSFNKAVMHGERSSQKQKFEWYGTMHPSHIPPPYFLKTHFNITIPYIPCLSFQASWSKACVQFLSLPCTWTPPPKKGF